jgi:hypothetical protein
MTEANRKIYQADEAATLELDNLRVVESDRIQIEVIPEKIWWGEHVVDDPSSPLLVNFPDEMEHFKLIGVLRGGKEPKLAREMAIGLVKEIDKRWQQKTEVMNVSGENILLAITSLYRTREMQDRLMVSSPLAARGYSSHLAGVAIDLDHNGYYIKQGDERIPVNSKSAFFNPVFTQILKEVILELEKEGACHVIVEKGYRLRDSGEIEEYEACFHVVASPDFRYS